MPTFSPFSFLSLFLTPVPPFLSLPILSFQTFVALYPFSTYYLFLVVWVLTYVYVMLNIHYSWTACI